jgi:hypothetical protein
MLVGVQYCCAGQWHNIHRGMACPMFQRKYPIRESVSCFPGEETDVRAEQSTSYRQARQALAIETPGANVLSGVPKRNALTTFFFNIIKLDLKAYADEIVGWHDGIQATLRYSSAASCPTRWRVRHTAQYTRIPLRPAHQSEAARNIQSFLAVLCLVSTLRGAVSDWYTSRHRWRGGPCPSIHRKDHSRPRGSSKKKLVRVLSFAANSHKLHGVRAVWLPGRLAVNINISSCSRLASSTSFNYGPTKAYQSTDIGDGKHTRLVWAIR